MRMLRPLCLVAVFCFVSLTTPAQQTTAAATPPTTSDPQAVALIQRALAVLTGGVSVSDVTLAGTVQRIAGSDTEAGTATLKATTLGDSWIGLVLPSGNRREIRNHAAAPLPGSLPSLAPAVATQAVQPAGAWSGPDGVIHGIANQNVMTDASWFFPAATISRVISTQSYVFSYIGSTVLNGAQVTHIQLFQPLASTINAPSGVAALMEHLSQMDLYLDPTTLLPVELSFSVHPDTNALLDIPTQIRFSGYQAVNGVQVPFHVQKYLNNSLVLDLQLSSASLNSGLAALTFQLQ
jgi:hypothetical protein